MKIRLKENPRKEFLKREISELESEMANLSSRKEYDICLEEWKQLNEQLKEMSLLNKVGKALPWLTLAVTAVGTIVVPIYGMNKAYKEEKEGNLKNGDDWNLATKSMKH